MKRTGFTSGERMISQSMIAMSLGGVVGPREI